MARHKVEICGVNTANIEVLSSDEVKSLFDRYKNNGDMDARDRLVSGNLKLVLSILKKFYNKVDNLDDLFQVGCLGLVKAIDNFDTSYDVKLSTYACPMILGEIKRYLRDNSALRVSRSVKDLAYKALKLKEEYIASNGVMPTNSYLAYVLGVSEFELGNAIDSLREPVSMYEPIYNDGGDTIYLYDQISNNDSEYDLDYKLALDKAISKLKVRDRKILEDRFIIGKTQMEIASELGISQAQISRIEKNAINSLKKYIK